MYNTVFTDGNRKIDLNDIIILSNDEGENCPFKIVGMIKDIDGSAYAIASYQEPGENSEISYVATDIYGTFVNDADFQNEILGHFLNGFIYAG